MDSLANGLGLYIHWPYCARICPYCDFNVYRPRDGGDELLDAILQDMVFWQSQTRSRRLASIHFGGGTPSLMSGRQVEAIISRAADLWGLEEGVEIGLEANPKDLARYADFKSAGVTRLSVGAQSFDDAVLKSLGRDHGADQSRLAITEARRVFSSVSIDLIYALADQDLAHWRGELTQALDFGVGHLSPYQLTIEAQTAFGKRTARGEVLDATPDLAADFYELTQQLCDKHGLAGYEISNHARSEAEQSRHNRLYWAGGDWIGVGPGAHGRVGASTAGGRRATTAQRRPQIYRDAVEAGGSTWQDDDILTASEEAAERILMGLRVHSGLDRTHLRNTTGQDIDLTALERWSEAKLMGSGGDQVWLTAAGRLLADRLSGELVGDVAVEQGG
jgi:putative oxygen-independent coproporphyrinogen III oxidase